MFKNCGRVLKSLYTGRYAVVTNTVTAGIAGCAADVTAQHIEMKDGKSFDFDRNTNMTIINTAMGTMAYYWYRFLDGKIPGKSRKSVVKKVSIDTLVSPIFYVPYLGGLCVFKNLNFNDFLSELKNKGPLLFWADLILWPLLQAFNFYRFPPYFRIIGFVLNDFFLEVVFSHIVNNDYSASNVLRWFTKPNK